jgi:hypothetical protein
MMRRSIRLGPDVTAGLSQLLVDAWRAVAAPMGMKNNLSMVPAISSSSVALGPGLVCLCRLPEEFLYPGQILTGGR